MQPAIDYPFLAALIATILLPLLLLVELLTWLLTPRTRRPRPVTLSREDFHILIDAARLWQHSQEQIANTYQHAPAAIAARDLRTKLDRISHNAAS
jgi:hypothetical protein